MTDQTVKFPGFPAEPFSNFWPYPHALNCWWKNLTPTEQKVLDYILRHTWGYQKNADAISISQFMHGIKRRADGSSVDGGTGIKNPKTVQKALKGLEAKCFITTISRQGGPTLFQLTIDPTQEMVGVPKNGRTPHPKNTSNPSQNLVPTINKTIKNNNTISPSGNSKLNSSKNELVPLIEYLSEKLGGVKFPNFGKQAKYAKSMLNAGYSTEDITWAIDEMHKNQWWRDNSFDLKNVADEIPKLMTRITKEKK